jgi:cytochrome c biogenesis protein CcdA
VPISIAIVAGGLAVVNPCGFAMLPAYLGFYVGADEQRLPHAATRILQGLLVGGLVALGFVGVFALITLPVSFGIGLVAEAVPWAGLATGAVLASAGIVTLLGRRIPLPIHLHISIVRERKLAGMLLFGIGYGAASLGCTLPLFLALVGASAGGSKVGTFVAYALGTTVVLMALSVLSALLRQGLMRAVRPALRYVDRAAGVLLVIAGGYLAYYWSRLQFGDTSTVADDPIVSFGIRFTATIEHLANGNGSTLVSIAGAIVSVALATTLIHHRRNHTTQELVRE